MKAVPSFIRLFGRFSPLLLPLMISACSSNWIRTPQNRFESPEGLGDSTISADVYTSGHINFAPKYSSPDNPTLVDDNPDFSSQSPTGNIGDDMASMLTLMTNFLQTVSFEGRSNVNDLLELYFNSRYEAMGLRAKYQFLGEPADRAKTGNFSLALDMGYGLNTTSSSTQLYRYSVLDYA